MLVYVYDGSFEGILTSVFEAFSRKEAPDAIVSEQGLQQDLTASYVFVTADQEKSDRVYASIWKNISEDALKNVYHTFLSEDPEAGTLIYRYLKLGWKMGSSVDMHLSDDTVFKIMDINRRVGFEVHRLMGFVRFRQVEGELYYSSISPDHNVVELLAPHFAERLSDQNWIIHDVKREIAALYNTKEWIMTEFTADEIPRATEEEKRYSGLWREFFKTLEIKSRSNPKLQRQLMPRRYWEHLCEKW
ncbi:MAG TPA: TIGR03915 family putative DNA repair protein [Clostridia bacterium]|nr:TIGR03915 family putative DNA repair protein [Clostridia bacterium]